MTMENEKKLPTAAQELPDETLNPAEMRQFSDL